MHLLRVSATCAAAFLVACGDGPAGISDEPRFELDVMGDIATSLEGDAYFGADTGANGEEVFAILLVNDNEEQMVLLAKAGTDRPAPGTYAFGSEAAANVWTGVFTSTEGDELLGFFIAESGSITITHSSSTRVRGTVSFTAAGFTGNFENPANVTVSGEFIARLAPN